VRVGTKVLTSEGKKSRQRVRVSKKSGEIVSAAKVK